MKQILEGVFSGKKPWRALLHWLCRLPDGWLLEVQFPRGQPSRRSPLPAAGPRDAATAPAQELDPGVLGQTPFPPPDFSESGAQGSFFVFVSTSFIILFSFPIWIWIFRTRTKTRTSEELKRSHRRGAQQLIPLALRSSVLALSLPLRKVAALVLKKPVYANHELK